MTDPTTILVNALNAQIERRQAHAKELMGQSQATSGGRSHALYLASLEESRLATVAGQIRDQFIARDELVQAWERIVKDAYTGLGEYTTDGRTDYREQDRRMRQVALAAGLPYSTPEYVQEIIDNFGMEED